MRDVTGNTRDVAGNTRDVAGNTRDVEKKLKKCDFDPEKSSPFNQGLVRTKRSRSMVLRWARLRIESHKENSS